MPLLILIAVVVAVVLLVRAGKSDGFSPSNPGVRRAGMAVAAVVLLVILAQDDDDEPTLQIEREPCPAYREEDCPSAISGFSSTTAATTPDEDDVPREPCPAYREEDCPPALTTTTHDPDDIPRAPCPAYREEDCPPATGM